MSEKQSRVKQKGKHLNGKDYICYLRPFHTVLGAGVRCETKLGLKGHLSSVCILRGSAELKLTQSRVLMHVQIRVLRK